MAKQKELEVIGEIAVFSGGYPFGDVLISHQNKTVMVDVDGDRIDARGFEDGGMIPATPLKPIEVSNLVRRAAGLATVDETTRAQLRRVHQHLEVARKAPRRG